MRFTADFHIHSKYSRATSRDCIPEMLDLWARRKGLDLIGTGDFTHPAWREELREKLAPAGDGVFVLKDAYRADASALPRRRVRREPALCRSVRFIGVQAAFFIEHGDQLHLQKGRENEKGPQCDSVAGF